ncbi:60S ribosomal protein L7a [Tupaia chinensis]|uniref:60S ribosomal protein L7a n=1 Tax=Tupaia chinensis TaxID=246437 RepID=L9L2L4_TUPCH|nr:60S ribosomal protein L7a [Tupaia chinensis]
MEDIFVEQCCTKARGPASNPGGAQYLKKLEGKVAKGKKMALAPAVVKKQETKKPVNPLFEKRPKNFGMGQGIQPKKDITH